MDLVFLAIATWSKPCWTPTKHSAHGPHVHLDVSMHSRDVFGHFTPCSCSELSANSWLFVCLFVCETVRLFVCLFVCLLDCLFDLSIRIIHINLCNQCVFTRKEGAYIQVFVLSSCSPRISTRWFFNMLGGRKSSPNSHQMVQLGLPTQAFLLVGTFCYPKWMVRVTGHCIYIYPNIPLYTRDLSADSSCKGRALVGCVPKDRVDDHQFQMCWGLDSHGVHLVYLFWCTPPVWYIWRNWFWPRHQRPGHNCVDRSVRTFAV